YLGSLGRESGRPGRQVLAVGQHRNIAELSIFERHQVNFDAGQLVDEIRIFGERATAAAFRLRKGAEPLDLAFGTGDTGNVIALMTEQELGVGPALVLFADAVLDRNADIFEEDFVEAVLLVDTDDRLDGIAGRLHIDEEEADPLLLLGGAVGPHKAEDHVGMLREGGPAFLAVDAIMIAVA